MVDTAVAPTPAPASPSRRRPWWRTAWVIAPLLFLVLLAGARIVYWRTSIAYSPLRPAGLGGAAVGQPRHVVKTPDGLALRGHAGTTQLVEFPIANTGIHPLDIQRVSTEDDAVVGVQWSANFVKNGHRVPSPTHALPVRVPGHAVVNLQLVVRRPSCSSGEPRYLSGVVTIHWHAMISPHATRLNLLRGHPQRIALCR